MHEQCALYNYFTSMSLIQCTRGGSLIAFFEDIHDKAKQKIAVVGCGCSTATEPVAEINHLWNITQVRQQYNLHLRHDY